MRTEDKVMNNGKLQAKKEKLKSLHCPSPQSSLFNSQHNEESATSNRQQLFIDVSSGLLRQGQSVRFCASGQSMHPVIKEGEIITVVPVALSDIKIGDILFYKLGKKVVAHRLISIKEEKSSSKSHSSANSLNHSPTQSTARSLTLTPQRLFILRGDASLTCDEPVETYQILGKVASVQKRSHNLNLCSRKARIFRFVYDWTSRLKRLGLHLLNIYQDKGLTYGGFR